LVASASAILSDASHAHRRTLLSRSYGTFTFIFFLPTIFHHAFTGLLDATWRRRANSSNSNVILLILLWIGQRIDFGFALGLP
jgi:hypothetical protein